MRGALPAPRGRRRARSPRRSTAAAGGREQVVVAGEHRPQPTSVPLSPRPCRFAHVAQPTSAQRAHGGGRESGLIGPDSGIVAAMSDVSTNAGAALADEGLDRETLIVAGVVMLGAIMSILDTTVINVAVDHLAVCFNSSLTTIQWVATGYTLSLAAVIPADRLGRGPLRHQAAVPHLARPVHDRIGASPVWPGASETLIVFRVPQGLGGGMIMPAVMTITTRKAGPHRMGRIMGVARRADAGRRRSSGRSSEAGWSTTSPGAGSSSSTCRSGSSLFVLGADRAGPRRAPADPRLDWIGLPPLSPASRCSSTGSPSHSTYGFGAARVLGAGRRGRRCCRRLLAH